MTLEQIQSLCTITIQNDKLLGVYPTLINQALREAQNIRSWSCMKENIELAISAGDSYATLPSDFKEPQGGQNSLQVTDPTSSDTGSVGWKMLSKQEFTKMVNMGLGGNIAYLDNRSDDTQRLVISADGVTADLTLNLDAYVFLPEVVLASDENYLMRNYPMMVQYFTNYYGFCIPDSERNFDRLISAKFYGLAKEQLSRASLDDSYRESIGRDFRMGGQ